ncbi:hypothetical protein AKJ09_03341 [Labilithrix luteola]|uniref:Uncharacterized protein n=1 Tax=Labilithrix luteola TaxID=1391654 RepID=A0A0K1PT32_9BACT|nr:hypothetical protein AKJ09_03341 [Labilithrix luteola]
MVFEATEPTRNDHMDNVVVILEDRFDAQHRGQPMKPVSGMGFALFLVKVPPLARKRRRESFSDNRATDR